jgi:sterol desaturase/sphingolipid hydroxylase (fatty acid hydroxylase superfamily)
MSTDRLISIADKFLDQCATAFVQGIIALAIGFVLFSLMERLFKLSRAKKSWSATLLDVKYALLSMLYPPFIYFIIAMVFGFLSLRLNAAAPAAGISPFYFGAELLAVLFARDCLIYLRHRIFHLRPVWAFHSVHHSSEEVDWISAVRFHPVENIIESIGEIALFLGCGLLGVHPAVLSAAGITIGFYNLFIHANLRWTFGPLRYVLVSPVFHRWHHSDTREAADKNFAAMFSCIDLLFGTFYMPKDLVPETLGLSAQEKPFYPRTFAEQLRHPFRRR